MMTSANHLARANQLINWASQKPSIKKATHAGSANQFGSGKGDEGVYIFIIHLQHPNLERS